MPDQGESYYEVLNVKRDASPEEITASYRKLAKVLHPDVCGSPEAEELFKGFTPDVAVIDLMMENDDDGFVLAYRLKRTFPDCAVIMVTNVTGETGLEFPRVDDSAGWITADAVLSKPVRFEQIEEELKKIGKG